MTGFGRGESIRQSCRLKMEIKSVNHRYSDISIKLPRFLNPFEDKIRKRLAEDITRGKVDIWIHCDIFAQQDSVINVNVNLADSYVEALSGLSNRYEFGKLTPELAITLLANHPDIITFDKMEASMSTENEHKELWESLKEALEEALTEFNQMRKTEGFAMVQDIESKCNLAKQIVTEISERAPEVLKEHSVRIRERMEDMICKMGQKPDDSRIITEMAVLMDKGCINEEIARLQSHFGQLYAILQEKDAIGRKLDFLIQELNREVNTIGSKSGDVDITAQVVELKSLIEKMREQAQNIE